MCVFFSMPAYNKYLMGVIHLALVCWYCAAAYHMVSRAAVPEGIAPLVTTPLIRHYLKSTEEPLPGNHYPR